MLQRFGLAHPAAQRVALPSAGHKQRFVMHALLRAHTERLLRDCKSSFVLLLCRNRPEQVTAISSLVQFVLLEQPLEVTSRLRKILVIGGLATKQLYITHDLTQKFQIMSTWPKPF